MSIEVLKFEIKTVTDASEFEQHVVDKRITADEVVAVIGKTEGNGGVNDFTRILSDQAYRAVLLRHGTRSEAEVKAIPMVWSRVCAGVNTPQRVCIWQKQQERTERRCTGVKGHRDGGATARRRHRSAGNGRKSGCRCAASHERRWDQQSKRRALRPDKDATIDHRLGAGRT